MVDFHLGRFRRDHSDADLDLALWKRDGDRLAPNLAARGARLSLGYERWPLPGAFGDLRRVLGGRPRRHDLVEVGTLPAVAMTEQPTS